MDFNKAIFLDIDGVIATIHEFNMNRYAPHYLHQYDIYPFNQACVKVLNELLALTKAEIIISSDWRSIFTTEELNDIFKINGVKQIPVEATADFSERFTGKSLEQIRTLEIESFLREHQVANFVVVDDLDMSEGFGDSFIQCLNIKEGIKEAGLINRIIKVLL